jgi:hypothetical protein
MTERGEKGKKGGNKTGKKGGKHDDKPAFPTDLGPQGGGGRGKNIQFPPA